MKWIVTVIAVFALVALASAWPGKFIEMPLIRQGRDYTCGVSATASVIAFWTDDEWLEDDLCRKLKCNNQDGTRYREIASFAQKQGYKAEVFQNMTLPQVFKIIDNGTPLIVLIQAWPDHYPVDWTKLWDDGHYAVVNGYDSKFLYFMDPSTTGHYTSIPHDEFLLRWHDEDGSGSTAERVYNFGLLLTRTEKPTYKFSEILPFE